MTVMHFKESEKPVLINSLVLLTLQLIKVELTATPSVMNLSQKKAQEYHKKKWSTSATAQF